MSNRNDEEEAKEEERSPGRNEEENHEYGEQWKEIEKSGSYGGLSRKEVIVVCGLILAAIIAALVVVIVVAADDDDGPDPAPVPAPIVSAAPSFAPTQGADIRLSTGFDLLKAASPQMNWPADVNDLSSTGAGALPQFRAARWILFVDNTPTFSEFFLWRYGLAVLFYQTGGTQWNLSTDWLTQADTCEWYGIVCDFEVIRDIKLNDNNLVGNIPNEVKLFHKLTSFWVRENQLSGEIPYASMSQMGDLRILHLENNLISGSLKNQLLSNGVLEHVYIQETDISGNIPQDFCSLESFAVSCDKVNCPCCLGIHCF